MSSTVATFHRVSMLSGTYSLFDIDDVEAFCREALNDHLDGGKRRADGSYTGPSQLSASDYEDALAYLIGVCWELSRRFNPVDDGRGTNRFSGFALSILHCRIVDWKRSRWRSTRYNQGFVEELTADERDLVATLVDFTGPEVLDLVNTTVLTEPRRRTLAVVTAAIREHGRFDVEDYAERSGKPVVQIERELAALSREIVSKELLAA